MLLLYWFLLLFLIFHCCYESTAVSFSCTFICCLLVSHWLDLGFFLPSGPQCILIQTTCGYLAVSLLASQNLLLVIFCKSTHGKSEWWIRLSIYVLFCWEPREPPPVFQRCFRSVRVINVLLRWSGCWLTVFLSQWCWNHPCGHHYHYLRYSAAYFLHFSRYVSSTQVSICNLCDVLFSREAAGSNTLIYSLRRTAVNTRNKKRSHSHLFVSLVLALFVTSLHN